MSRSRLRSQTAFDGAYQSVISSAFVVGFSFTRDDRLAEDLLIGEVVAVAAAGVDAAVLADRRPEPRPQAAAARVEAAHLLRREVEAVELVRIAAAALRGRRVDDVVDEIEAVGLAVGRQEQLGRRRILTGRDVELAQPAVPGDDVGDVLAGGLRRPDDRRRGQPARTQRVRAAAAGGLLEVLSKCRFQICLPVSRSMP